MMLRSLTRAGLFAAAVILAPAAAAVGASQLINAAESGDVELVRQLIDGGADLNKQERFGAALHRALASYWCATTCPRRRNTAHSEGSRSVPVTLRLSAVEPAWKQATLART